MMIASEWSKAMKSSEPRDFVSVGDISIKAIGAENQIPDSEIPVRQILEQITAKLSIPPFLLGLSWSTTERMSYQQADMLTSELEYYRRILCGCIGKICRTFLVLGGYDDDFEIVSLTGTVSKGKAHIHISLSDSKGRVVGGHLSEGCLINTTFELVLGVLEEYKSQRVFDEKTGYDEIIFEKEGR